MERDKCTRVFLAQGVVTHLIPLAKSDDTKHPALCGTSPRLIDPGAYWRGTGSRGEYERAAELPVCRRCADAVEKHGTGQ